MLEEVAASASNWKLLEARLSLGWFEGKITGKSHMTHGKIYGFRLRFSLKSTHWVYHLVIHHNYVNYGLNHHAIWQGKLTSLRHVPFSSLQTLTVKIPEAISRTSGYQTISNYLNLRCTHVPLECSSGTFWISTPISHTKEQRVAIPHGPVADLTSRKARKARWRLPRCWMAKSGAGGSNETWGMSINLMVISINGHNGNSMVISINLYKS